MINIVFWRENLDQWLQIIDDIEWQLMLINVSRTVSVPDFMSRVGTKPVWSTTL